MQNQKNSKSRRTALGLAVAVAAGTLFTAPAWAQAYPSRVVRVVIPFPPGGTLDTVGRQLAQKLSEQTGQSFIIENRPGGNGTIGADIVAKAPADGYTLGIVTGNHSINPLLTNKLPYDTFKDLTGVMLLTRFQMLAYAHPSLPANTPAELIALACAVTAQSSINEAWLWAYWPIISWIAPSAPSETKPLSARPFDPESVRASLRSVTFSTTQIDAKACPCHRPSRRANRKPVGVSRRK